MGTPSEQHYSLRWNDYTVKIVTAFQSLRDEEDFVDVTIACDGHHYSAHKMVLSACSPYFRSLLRANPCQHPIVILKDVGHIEMERLLEFMYNGEVNIAQDQLAAFLKTAEGLKIRGLAGTSDDLDQSQIRDPHSFLSGGTATIGGMSGRNSPLGFNSSQDGKEEDISTDGIFHTSSPSIKRRKRGTGLSTVSQADNSSHADMTADGLMDGSNDRVNMSGDHGLEMDDDRMDRRELKSEPNDSLGDVYGDSDMGPDHSQHSDGLAGPSGAMNQDGLSPGENAAAPSSAVCEALNLSLRSTPATPQMNGCSTSLLGSSISFQPHIMERSLYQSCSLQTPSNSITFLTSPIHNQFKCENVFEESLHPDNLLDSASGSGIVASTAHIYATESSIDMVCASEKKPIPELDYQRCQMTASISENTSLPTHTSAPLYKDKVYPCPECLKVFRHPMSLHHHRHVHKGTYTCQSCGKVFSRRWDLHRHEHRSKMGCRRANQASVSNESHLGMSSVVFRQDRPYDLNNSPSN